jgi:hypothetical protein
MVSGLFFLLGLLLVASPGICCWKMLFPDDTAEQCLAWGSVLDIAAAVYLAYVSSFADLSWFYAAWTAPLILSVGWFASCHWKGGSSLSEIMLGSVMC